MVLATPCAIRFSVNSFRIRHAKRFFSRWWAFTCFRAFVAIWPLAVFSSRPPHKAANGKHRTYIYMSRMVLATPCVIRFSVNTFQINISVRVEVLSCWTTILASLQSPCFGCLPLPLTQFSNRELLHPSRHTPGTSFSPVHSPGRLLPCFVQTFCYAFHTRYRRKSSPWAHRTRCTASSIHRRFLPAAAV